MLKNERPEAATVPPTPPISITVPPPLTRKSVTVTRFLPGNPTAGRNMPPKAPKAPKKAPKAKAKSKTKARKVPKVLEVPEAPEAPKASKNAKSKNPVSRTWTGACQCAQDVGHWPFHNAEGDVHPEVKYLVVDQQIGEETKRYHKQWFVRLKSACRMAGAKRILGCRDEDGKLVGHVEIPRDNEAARLYCIEDAKKTRIAGTEPRIVGDWKECHQGYRSDIDAMLAEIKDGASFKDIMETYTVTWARNINAVKQMFAENEPKYHNRKVPKCVVWWGPPGSGKTTKLIQKIEDLRARGHTVYEYSEDNGWWDGYTGQEVIVFNNFEDKDFDRTTWIRIVDKGNFAVKRRYVGPRVLENKLVLMTAVKHPEEWWLGQGPQKEILRRFDYGEIIECEEIPEEDRDQEDRAQDIF